MCVCVYTTISSLIHWQTSFIHWQTLGVSVSWLLSVMLPCRYLFETVISFPEEGLRDLMVFLFLFSFWFLRNLYIVFHSGCTNLFSHQCTSVSFSAHSCQLLLFLVFLICATVLCLVAQLCLALWGPMDCNAPGSSVHGDSPDKSIGMSCHALLPGVFPTEGLNPDVPHCRRILYCLSHQGSPRILQWVVYPISRRSSQPRNWTGVSCVTGGFLISWAPREACFWCVSYQIVLCHFMICINLCNCHCYKDSDPFKWSVQIFSQSPLHSSVHNIIDYLTYL